MEGETVTDHHKWQARWWELTGRIQIPSKDAEKKEAVKLLEVCCLKMHCHHFPWERYRRSKAIMQKKQLIVLEEPIDIRGNKLHNSMKIKDTIVVMDIIGIIPSPSSPLSIVWLQHNIISFHVIIIRIKLYVLRR